MAETKQAITSPSDKPKHAGGRPSKFTDVSQLNALFLNWKEEFKEEGSLIGEIPDVEGFCDYIDCYRDLLCEYEKKAEYSDAIKRIKNWIYYRKKQLAMQNKMNPAIFIFDAKNNAGYKDRTEVEETGEQKIIIETRRHGNKDS